MSLPTEVLVIGGGSAGIGAAMGAAQNGAEVTILEQAGYFGGMASSALVGTVCGLYYQSEEKPKFVHEGFCREFAEKLSFYSKSEPQKFLKGLWFLPYDSFAFRKTSDEFLFHPANSVLFHSTGYQVGMDGNKIVSVDAHVRDRSVSFIPKVVIDCTGEGSIARMANEKELLVDHYQAGAVVFQLIGIEKMPTEQLRNFLIKEVIEGTQKGALPKEFESLSIIPGSHKHQEVYLKIALPDLMKRTEQVLTHTEHKARIIISKFLEYLHAGSSLLKNVRIGEIPSTVGIRTGPRFMGRHVLSSEEVLSSSKRNDSIARGVWPIEKWTEERRPEMSYFNVEDYYDIPLGAICAATTENLLFAGKLISADEEASASARVIGTSLQTGYAAGVVAAFMSKGKLATEALISIKQQSSL